MLLLLLLLLRYEGGGPRLSRRTGELPCPAGRAGGGRAVLVRTGVVTKRRARALLTVVGGGGERAVHLLRSERTAHSSAWSLCGAGSPVVESGCGDVLIIYSL